MALHQVSLVALMALDREIHSLLSLFVIVMETLTKIISALVDRGLLSGFMVGSTSGGAINISHLLFADDTLIFS
jgi:hypothetical protein